jgi:hypothetical protein
MRHCPQCQPSWLRLRLYYNAGGKPILPLTLKPPIATAKPARSNAPSGRTSRFGEPHQPSVTRRGAGGDQHGAVDSDVQTRPRRHRRGAAFYLAKNRKRALEGIRRPRSIIDSVLASSEHFLEAPWRKSMRGHQDLRGPRENERKDKIAWGIASWATSWASPS